MRYVRAGDQLVFTSMDRCARSLIDLHSIVEELVQRGVSVKFIKEGQTYSKDSTPVAKLMLGFVGCGGGVRTLHHHQRASGRGDCSGEGTGRVSGPGKGVK
ncbi:recombinase family protein [Corynebacterium resistens]|uniref:recombinase family protein n=1 Tax=Corynebacterium resistens TaxID=258224 RepID=UPI002356D2B5|nr:recombinase family protein [Corynebacterium resistens]